MEASMNDTPEQLCKQAREGDLAAASELVRAFHERIYAYFRRHTGDDSEAADLTQKTFFKVWVSLGSLRSDAGFPAWLHGIAHHVWVDWCRQRRPTDSRPDEWWESCDSGGRSPFENAAERDAAARLYRLVDQLRPEVREVRVPRRLRSQDGFQGDEIGQHAHRRPGRAGAKGISHCGADVRRARVPVAGAQSA